LSFADTERTSRMIVSLIGSSRVENGLVRKSVSLPLEMDVSWTSWAPALCALGSAHDVWEDAVDPVSFIFLC